MAISWGSWDGHLIVGCEVVRDGADALFRWYVGIDGWDYADTQQLNYSGDDSGSKSYFNDLTAGSHGTHQGSVTDYMQVDTQRVTGSPGETVTVTATLSGSYISTETPHKTASISLANVPATPTVPTVTSITQSSATVNMVLPSNNGSTITQTKFYIYTAATGGTLVTSYTSTTAATSKNFTGLSAATTYYADVAATNAIGTSAHSTRKAFTTGSLVAPSAPVVAVASSVTQTTATVTGAAPATNGSIISGYQFQVALASDFASLQQDVSQPGLVLSLTGKVANTHYYIRYRANSNNGYSDWSPTLDLLTSPTVPSTPAKPVLDSTTSDGIATFSFVAPDNGGSAITGYLFQVDESDYSTPLSSVTSTALTRTISGLPLDTPLKARVRAINAIGNGAYSVDLEFTISPGGDFIIHSDGEFVAGEFYFNNYGEWIKVT